MSNAITFVKILFLSSITSTTQRCTAFPIGSDIVMRFELQYTIESTIDNLKCDIQTRKSYEAEMLRPVGQLVGRYVGQSVNWLVGLPVGQSVGRFVSVKS